MALRKTTSIVLILTLVLCSACRTLADNPERIPSSAIEPSPDVALASVGRGLAELHGAGTSGFLCIPDGELALRWRLILIDQAEQTIDAQYYIMHGSSGGLVLERLLQAAERGVRVRLLVDDHTVHSTDYDMAHLGAHENFEARLFNPKTVRSGLVAYTAEYVVSLNNVNQRMHNKLLVADNHLGIIGGRNIGDEYFGINPGYNFLDFDALAAGPVVPKMSEYFDLYWNSEMAYPVESLTHTVKQSEVLAVRRKLQKALEERAPSLVSFQDSGGWDAHVDGLPEAMIPGDPQVIWDDVTEEGEPQQVAEALVPYFQQAQDEITIFMAYVIPTPSFVELLREAVERGVSVTIVTNSLATLDWPAANAFFKKYRPEVLQAGVTLHELRPDARDRHLVETPPVEGGVIGMHTKLMVFDHRHVFVGSFNLEPRAWHYNREDGVLIDSPEMAVVIEEHAAQFCEPENSWHVHFDEEGQVVWESFDGVLADQPALDEWQRLGDALIGAVGVPAEYQ